MTTSQWVNTEPDAGALHVLLARLAEQIPAAGIDVLWIFPTRRIAIGESTVFVVAGFHPDDPERRRVITARFAVTRDRKGAATVQEKLDEHGTAPDGAVARIVHGVLRRLGEEGEQPPREQTIGGDEERWWDLIEELGGRRPEAPPPPDDSAPASADLSASATTAENDPGAPTVGAPGITDRSAPESPAGQETSATPAEASATPTSDPRDDDAPR